MSAVRATGVRFLAIVAVVVILIRCWQAGVIVMAIEAALFVLLENLAELVQTARSRGT